MLRATSQLQTSYTKFEEKIAMEIGDSTPWDREATTRPSGNHQEIMAVCQNQ